MNTPKTNNYLYEIDDSFVLDRTIDAKNKKTAILFTLASFVLYVLVALPFIGIIKNSFDTMVNVESDEDLMKLVIGYGVFAVALIGYIILHEITHGIAYKSLTHEKLTFGLTLTVAYCGVPGLYVNKKASLIALLAPFTVFTIIFLPLIFIVEPMFQLFAVFLFAIHFGGCVGDLYDTIIILTKYKGKELYIKDTGPTQYFYIKK